MDLVKAQQLCLQLMNQHGLTAEKGWKFEWISSTRAAGKCHNNGGRKVVGYSWDGQKKYAPTGIANGGTIMLSKFITQHHDDDDVRDTILHEIAHGLTPGHGHDYVWKTKAIEIGCNGERCYEVKGQLAEVREKISKVIGTCPKCEHKFFMTRMPKRNQWCKCTNRRFIQSEKIIWVLNDNIASKQIPTPIIPIAASRGFNQYVIAAQSGTCFSNQLLNQIPDSYKSMLDKFEREFLPLINNDKDLFNKIISKAITSNSWRTMNREVRKACNQYMVDTDKMTNKAFQEMFFYESVMIGRTGIGSKAPWIGGKPS